MYRSLARAAHRLTVQRETALKTVIRTRPTETHEIENIRKL